MKIGTSSLRERVFIIAEIGNNHEGDPAVARDMVRLAAEAGADAVKFQTVKADLFVSPSDAARYERMKRFELDEADFLTLRDDAQQHGLAFISTPLDMHSARFLGPLVDAMKIASGDNTFMPLLQHAGACAKPVILSTGLADLSVVRRAVETIEKAGRSAPGTHPLAILHCVSAYPTAPADANLKAIETLAASFDYTVGYSDHTLGIDAPVAAVAVGARIVEKHFTLDKNYSDFRDHALSADPDEMAELVSRVRATEVLLGTGKKEPRQIEKDAEVSLRRSIAAAHDLPSGHVVGYEDLMWIRPGSGMAPGDESLVIGRRLCKSMAKADLFDTACFEHIAA